MSDPKLPLRIRNAARWIGLTCEDLGELPDWQLLRIPGCGRKTLNEFRKVFPEKASVREWNLKRSMSGLSIEERTASTFWTPSPIERAFNAVLRDHYERPILISQAWNRLRETERQNQCVSHIPVTRAAVG